jgi:hypothetical protein
MIVPAIPRWEKNEDEFRLDGKAIIRFALGIDYRETDGIFWPESEYECIWNELDEIWLIRREENGEELYHYKAETLDVLTDLIQEDLVLDSTVYDIFNCYVEEWREFED